MDSFSFLHLSDIHYMNGPDAQNIQERVIKKIKEVIQDKGPVQCIVITGDFFQAGQYIRSESANAKDCIEFLERISKICLHTSLRGSWKKHIVYCPGNHDVTRDATWENENENRPRILTRKAELREKGDSNKGRIISDVNNDYYKLLTKGAFSFFRKIISEKLQVENSEETNYEYRIFQYNLIDSNRQIIFVAFNTALYAGFERKKEEIKRELAAKHVKIADAVSNHFIDLKEEKGYEAAERAFKEYLQLHNELVNGEAHDFENLRFISEHSENELKGKLKKIQEKCEEEDQPLPFYIFLGHHPLSWFTIEAQKNFGELAKELFNSKILYLCGHEHKPKVDVKKIPITNDDNICVQEQMVGGSFADKAEWNVPSFAYDTITFEKNSFSLSGEIYYWRKTIVCAEADYRRDSIVQLSEREYKWGVEHFGNKDEIIGQQGIKHVMEENEKVDICKKGVHENEALIKKVKGEIVKNPKYPLDDNIPF